MSFILLPMGTLHKKREKKRLKNFPAGYVGKFYRCRWSWSLFCRIWFLWEIANDADIPAADVQKYILVTSDFAKGIQTDINNYVTKDRINNVSFRQKAWSNT